jgi:hypothetical protein
LDKLLETANFKKGCSEFLCQVPWYWVPCNAIPANRYALEGYYEDVVQSALRCFNIRLNGAGFEAYGIDSDPYSDNFRRLFWCLLARKMFSDLLQEVKEFNQRIFPV